MKPIKIHPDNASAIEAALKEVNGRAYDHAYTEFSEVQRLADEAENYLSSIGLPIGMRSGAEWHETSGSAVSNAYARKAFTRRATAVTLSRKSSSWYLVSVKGVDIRKDGGGSGVMTLTPAQDVEAIRRFKTKYRVSQD